MAEIRKEGTGRALFATKAYAFGDVILSETPLLAMPRATPSGLPGMLETLKTAFAGVAPEKQAIVLDLFCPTIEELKRTGTHLTQFEIPCKYEDVANQAKKLSCTNEEATNLARLFFIWNFNATQYQGTKSAVFEVHARINHSCCPNATFHAGVVRAVQQISPGDLVTISYLEGQDLLASTRLRRRKLQRSYSFLCNCGRCVRAVDLSRTMLCPACNRCTAVWGLSLEENSSEEVVASCIACNTAHRKLDLPLDEEENLEKQVQSILLLGGSPVEKTHDLQARVLKILGGAHWTAAALMELRYRKDPMVNGFIVMQWGEAEARWRRLAVAEIPWLYYMSIFALGNGCKPHLQRQQGQTVFALAGRRYWNECYEFCRKFWGEEDQDVQNMEAMFERCRTRRSRPDVVVCTYNKCVKAIDDRVGGAGPNLKRCAACGLARYCDKACQKSDWHDHQEVCKKVGALKDLEAVKEWLNTHPTHFG